MNKESEESKSNTKSYKSIKELWSIAYSNANKSNWKNNKANKIDPKCKRNTINVKEEFNLNEQATINRELAIKNEIIENSKNLVVNSYKSKLRSNNNTYTNSVVNDKANTIISIWVISISWT